MDDFGYYITQRAAELCEAILIMQAKVLPEIGKDPIERVFTKLFWLITCLDLMGTAFHKSGKNASLIPPCLNAHNQLTEMKGYCFMSTLGIGWM